MVDDHETGDGQGAAADGAEGDARQESERAAKALERMMSAREAWHRARGEQAPSEVAEQSGSPGELSASEAERRFLAAREAWLRQNETPGI